MLEDEGHWLRLMRTATIPTDANICLRISGKDIVCTVTKDVNKEVELKVTCRIADPCHEQKLEHSPCGEENLKFPEASKLAEVEPEEREAVPKDCTSTKTMLDCVTNSVCSYSETATCSSSLNSREVSEERSVKSEEGGESDIDMDEFKDEVSSSTVHGSPSSDLSKDMRMKSEDETSHSSKPNEAETRRRRLNDENATQTSPRHEFSSTEAYAQDKHVYSHHSPSSIRSSTSNLTNPKSFCDACKIQFMSINTYQVHKKFYCKSRHETEDLTDPMPVLEATSGGLSAAFKPSPDTVILRSGMNGGVAPSIIQPQAIYAAISTNPLILLPCTLVPGQGLVPQNGVVPTGSPGIVLQSGIACPTIVEKVSVSNTSESNHPPRKTSHPVMNNASQEDSTLLSSSKIATLKRKISEGDVLNLKKQCTSNETVTAASEKSLQNSKDAHVEQDSPLDLSLKAKKVTDAATLKSPIRRRNSVISIGHPLSPILSTGGSGTPPGPPVISSVHNIPSPTNSFSNESSGFMSQVPVVVHRVSQAERISPLPPVLQSAVVEKPIPTPGMLPPKLMKQGNNVCEECHIVFIKYDNLVTHKKHYCAYRRRQLNALAAAAAAASVSTQEQSSDDNNSNHSAGDGAQNFLEEDPGKSGLRKLEYGVEHYRQIITKPQQPVYCCDACGVKFSTSDTLIAHQTYYCMKKPDSAMSKATAKKGDESNSKDVESPFSGPEEWKCNYCDATCSSYETIRRHLLTHSRGYRCLLCGYKGNTLRGMRTHACEHLTEDTTSIEEFMSTTVISETGGNILIPRPLECSDEDSDSKGNRQRERTSSNNSDNVKDKSLRHERLIADPSESEELSNSSRSTENTKNDGVLRTISSIKTESGDSNSDISGNQETVNPLAFCDVVIKTENDRNDSGDDSDRNEIKNEQDYDSDERLSAPRSLSVIRVAEQHEEAPHSSKRKSKPQAKSNSDLKSCKSCGVSFQHLSNLLTHKKYYCVSRVLHNRLPETATVQ